ncbi:neuromedin-S-like isoform X1 [Oncorhynchus keta]|uniref:neuromedin-S-like isoform X1 n=1 Tax=Oncorhynchus keta TaxID=8018 RepID=UPI0015FB8A7C|nr:neuromedin-S-like isoform X1 [Oncorhynchus keta]
MSTSYLQQLCILQLVWCLGCWKATEACPYKECEHGIVFRRGSGIQTDVGDMMGRDQNEEQVQNVFKRFLFHYSKANSVDSVQHASHSVHPLMRLSPKLSQRRKKQLMLLVSSVRVAYSD